MSLCKTLSPHRRIFLLVGILSVYAFSSEAQKDENHFRLGWGLGLENGLVGLNVGYNFEKSHVSISKSAGATLTGIDFGTDFYTLNKRNSFGAHIAAGIGFDKEGWYAGGGPYYKNRPFQRNNFYFCYGLDAGYMRLKTNGHNLLNNFIVIPTISWNFDF